MRAGFEGWRRTIFLGKGTMRGGKGDFQGCSEFNPVLIFSQKDQKQVRAGSRTRRHGMPRMHRTGE